MSVSFTHWLVKKIKVVKNWGSNETRGVVQVAVWLFASDTASNSVDGRGVLSKSDALR